MDFQEGTIIHNNYIVNRSLRSCSTDIMRYGFSTCIPHVLQVASQLLRKFQKDSCIEQ